MAIWPTNGYVRSGPAAGGNYYQTVRALQDKTKYGRNMGLNARSQGMNSARYRNLWPSPQTRGGGGGAADPPPAAKKPDNNTAGAVDTQYDYRGDPILQSFDVQTRASRDALKAKQLERQKQILLGFGSRQLAEEILGAGDPFLDTISDDPANSTSALAQLGYTFDLNKLGLTEAMNDENLYYSGAHADAQGRLGRERMLQEAGLFADTREKLSSLTEMLEAFEREQRLARVSAEQGAYQRAIEAAKNAGGNVAAETPAVPTLIGTGTAQSPGFADSDYGTRDDAVQQALEALIPQGQQQQAPPPTSAAELLERLRRMGGAGGRQWAM